MSAPSASPQGTGVITYSSNNSGGSWWLKDKDWYALEEAGWVVHWHHDLDDPSHVHAERDMSMFSGHTHAYDSEHLLTKVTPNGERFLGALAQSAAKATNNPDEAIAEWERITGQNSTDEGCNCCGEPHSFTFIAADGSRRYSSVEVVATRRKWS